MANQEHRDGDVPHPRPEVAAGDPRSAASERQVRDNDEADRLGTAHVHAPTPNEVSESTVSEIAEEAEARARR